VKYIPVLDCVYNQSNTCIEPQRISDVGLTDDEDDAGNPYNPPEDYTVCNNHLCGGCKSFKGAPCYKKIEIESPLTWQEGLKKGQRFARACGFDYRLLCYSTGSVTVGDIDDRLQVMEEFDDFIPDIIIYDYADILAAEDPRADKRDRVNDTWKAMRRQSQDWHSLVIAATQADAEAFDARILRPRNFSEDRRKMDHVTSCIGLNQLGYEKRAGIMRLNELAAREEFFEVTDTVSVLQALDIGRPHLGSFRTHDTEN